MVQSTRKSATRSVRKTTSNNRSFVIGVPTFRLKIRKVGGRWSVSDPPAVLDRRNAALEWQFDSTVKDDVSAHFQFASDDLLENFPGGSDLTRDLTAMLVPGQTLTLRVKPDACRRKNPRYYAVWIRDASLPQGGEFAVGGAGNPPPEINVGP